MHADICFIGYGTCILPGDIFAVCARGIALAKSSKNTLGVKMQKGERYQNCTTKTLV